MSLQLFEEPKRPYFDLQKGVAGENPIFFFILKKGYMGGGTTEVLPYATSPLALTQYFFLSFVLQEPPFELFRYITNNWSKTKTD